MALIRRAIMMADQKELCRGFQIRWAEMTMENNCISLDLGNLDNVLKNGLKSRISGQCKDELIFLL